MKILSKKKELVKVEVESIDDLWYLSHIIEPGDLVSASTERKIKIGGEDDRKAKVVKKWVTLQLEVEKIELNGSLRLGGVVTNGPENITRGSHHTINVEEGTKLEIQKEWLNYQLDKLKEASEKIEVKVLIVCHDRENAIFGMLTRRGMKILSDLSGNVAKKGNDEKISGDFYKQISKTIQEYDKREEPGNIILASPGFWRDYSIKEIPSELQKKIIQATCSTVDGRGLSEVMKRPELKQVLEKDRTRKDESFVEEVMTAISKDQACYGIKECEEKVSLGSVKLLLVSDNFIKKTREDNIYSKLDSIMKNTEKMNGEVHIVSSDEASSKLDSLGGVAGILRWQT